jgi:hypothetical protein
MMPKSTREIMDIIDSAQYAIIEKTESDICEESKHEMAKALRHLEQAWTILNSIMEIYVR